MDKKEITIIKETEKNLQNQNWNIIASKRTKIGKELIRKELKDFGIKKLPYIPNMLMEKDGNKYAVIFSDKEKFPYSKSKNQFVTGFDWYKLEIAKEIERKTNIQIGIVMRSKEDNKIIFRQMNQMSTKPRYWFKEEGCLLAMLNGTQNPPPQRTKIQQEKKQKRLELVYKKHRENIKKEIKEIKEISLLKKEELPILKCLKCNKKYPYTCKRCIKYKKQKALAIWNVDEFETNHFTPQLQLPLM